MSRCTCSHVWKQHRANGWGRCDVALCRCLFGPGRPKPRALPEPKPRAIATAHPDGIVETFRRPQTFVTTAQSLTIHDWHPATSANRSHDHWRKTQKAHHADRDIAWSCAMQAEWQPVAGRVLLTIVLVYPRLYRMDADNLAAKCKGLIDGLKSDYRNNHGRLGWFADDSTEWLDLVVRAEVQKGVKQTRITLEPIPSTRTLTPAFEHAEQLAL